MGKTRNSQKNDKHLTIKRPDSRLDTSSEHTLIKGYQKE